MEVHALILVVSSRGSYAFFYRLKRICSIGSIAEESLAMISSIARDMLATRPKRRDGCVLYLPRPMSEKLTMIRTKDRSDTVISVKIQFTNETPNGQS